MSHIDKAIALNKQGAACFSRGEYADAIRAFQEAIDVQPNYTDAYYNLGLALGKAGRKELALQAYMALLALDPAHLGGRFQLGCFYMEKANYQMALVHFLMILESDPEHVETLVNTAACYFNLANLKEAKEYYLQVLAVEPTDKQSLFNLGVIHMQQGRVKEAVEFYLRIIALDPSYYDAQYNLGVAYLTIKDIPSALQHFQQCLRLRPRNEALRYTVSVLRHDTTIASAPAEYIHSLFNAYATHYDTHLVKTLQYQVPERLFELLQTVRQPSADWVVLDLGCGTGLAGCVFKPYAHTLIGVDISEQMLDVAAEKQVYDSLFVADILPFLQDKCSVYDLMVAADVLVYFGQLEALFQAMALALKPGAYLLFNVEINEQADYSATESGRFRHHATYIERLAAQNGLRLVAKQQGPMRLQHHQIELGDFYLLERQS